MKYDLYVKIIPKDHYIKVTGKVENIDVDNGANIFLLNKNFNFTKLIYNQEQVRFKYVERPYDSLCYTDSEHIILEYPTQEIKFEYDGYLTEIISGVNQINEDIVELASYSGWYPYSFLFEDNTENFKLDSYVAESFEFNLKVELPADYVFAANAEITRIDKLSENTTIYNLSSYETDGDIVIFASNKVEKIKRSINDITISAICPPAMIKKNTLKLDILIDARQRITQLLGDPNNTLDTCYINRPYGGWGYARTTCIIMPGITDENDESLNDLSEQANIHFARLDFHELAHFWWSIAPQSDSNDWINEGGAEFTMLCLTKDMLNLENYNGLIKQNQYIELINGCPSDEAIIDTPGSGVIREINFYHKTAIMYIGAEIRFGRENLFKFLKEFYEQCQIECDGSTEKFLNICENTLGEEAKAYFYWLLSVKGWKNIDIEKDILKL